jgi:hypothetical protein
MPAREADQSRWLKTVGTVGLAVLLALFVAMLATNWVVIDVRELDRDGAHVVVPVPLNALRIPLHMMPRASVRVPLRLDDELDRSRCIALLEELRRAPEGTVMPLCESGGRATISRQGGKLVIAVADRDDVRVTLPFDGTLALLHKLSGERFAPVEALDLLASAERGELVAVDAREARVRIRRF